jgi:hypothetical protein
MIIPSKWYPMVQPRYDFQKIVFDKAVEKVDEDYRLAIKARKVELARAELEVELYNKKARVNQLELAMFKNRRLDLYA